VTLSQRIQLEELSDERVDWDGLVTLLLHETQLHIIEAMRWIDRPVSASQLVQVFDGSTYLSTVAYHVRHLRKLGVVRQSWSRPVRGATERFYRLTPPRPAPAGDRSESGAL
jgi:hypothetical protein